MFKELKKIWCNITQDATGHYVALDTFKAISFGCGILHFMVVHPVAEIFYDKDISQDAGYWLTSLAFGLQFVKLGASYVKRLTADAQGNPLATPASVEPPATEPELMPVAAPGATVTE